MGANVRMATRKRKRWTDRVAETSKMLNLEPRVFTLEDPEDIARSLKRSVDRSLKRQAESFPSAMSMLNFFINRAGKHLPRNHRARLEAAKDELRSLYGRSRSLAS